MKRFVNNISGKQKEINSNFLDSFQEIKTEIFLLQKQVKVKYKFFKMEKLLFPKTRAQEKITKILFSRKFDKLTF